MKKDKEKNNSIYHRIIIACLVVVMIVSAVDLVGDYMTNKRAEEEYRRLASLAQQTTEATTEVVTEAVTEAETEPPYISPINFEELMEVNPDTVGWIRIPGTNIDYPIVQTDNNDTYLHTDFNGAENVLGTVYLDYESQGDMMGKNNIIYGHNMKNGSMFKDIVRYKDQEYFKDHQYFEIYTPERTLKLKAVACYYAKAEPIVRKTRFKTPESYEAFVRAMLEPCTFAEIPEEPVEALYTFVTCSYEVNDARTLLFAVEVE